MSNTTHITPEAYHQLAAIEKAGYREVWQWKTIGIDWQNDEDDLLSKGHSFDYFTYANCMSDNSCNTRRIYIPIEPETVKEENAIMWPPFTDLDEACYFIRTRLDCIRPFMPELLQKASLIDLSECEFDIQGDDEGIYCNAERGGVVIDALGFDGNIFTSMDGNGDMWQTNPQYPIMNLLISKFHAPPIATTEERANKLWDEIANTQINDPFEFDLTDAKPIKAVDEQQLITIPLWQAKKIEDCFRIVSNHLKSEFKSSCMDRDIMQSYEWIKNAIAGESDKQVFRS